MVKLLFWKYSGDFFSQSWKHFVSLERRAGEKYVLFPCNDFMIGSHGAMIDSRVLMGDPELCLLAKNCNRLRCVLEFPACAISRLHSPELVYGRYVAMSDEWLIFRVFARG